MGDFQYSLLFGRVHETLTGNSVILVTVRYFRIVAKKVMAGLCLETQFNLKIILLNFICQNFLDKDLFVLLQSSQ